MASPTADDTHKLNVTSPNMLLDHAGSSTRVKINKAAPSVTASILLQDGNSGRTEMGSAETIG